MKAQRPAEETEVGWDGRQSEAVARATSQEAPELTCKCEKHAGRFQEVVSPFAFAGVGAEQAEGAQEGEDQAEDGDGCCRDVVFWRGGGSRTGWPTPTSISAAATSTFLGALVLERAAFAIPSTHQSIHQSIHPSFHPSIHSPTPHSIPGRPPHRLCCTLALPVRMRSALFFAGTLTLETRQQLSVGLLKCCLLTCSPHPHPHPHPRDMLFSGGEEPPASASSLHPQPSLIAAHTRGKD